MLNGARGHTSAEGSSWFVPGCFLSHPPQDSEGAGWPHCRLAVKGLCQAHQMSQRAFLGQRWPARWQLGLPSLSPGGRAGFRSRAALWPREGGPPAAEVRGPPSRVVGWLAGKCTGCRPGARGLRPLTTRLLRAPFAAMDWALGSTPAVHPTSFKGAGQVTLQPLLS